MGITDAGYAEVPQNAASLVDFVVRHLPHAGVKDCASCIDALCDLVPSNDVRLLQVVQRYADLVPKASKASRQHVVYMLSRAGFPE